MKRPLGATTLAYPTPAWIVCTYDPEGRPNAAAVAWAGICNSEPPCMTISLRKATHTYKNLMHRPAYTINIPSEQFLEEADYFGMVSGVDHDKFKATRLTPVASTVVDAPYIREFPVVIECNVIKTFDLGLHTMFIGAIQEVRAEEECLNAEGLPDIEKIRPIVFSPGEQRYFGIGPGLGPAFESGMRFVPPSEWPKPGDEL